MVISLFHYATELHLSSPSFNGQLENTTMFSDRVVVHKNMDNPLHVKISDRDRVRYKVSEDVTFQLRFRVIDGQDVVVSNTYLTPQLEGNFFSVVLSKDFIDELEADEVYSFIITKVEDDVETPLYLDHDFNTQGQLEVRGNYRDTYSETHTHTEPYPVFRDYKTRTKMAKHVFSVIVPRDEVLYSVRLVNVAETDTKCILTVEKNSQGHYPFTERAQQWDEVLTLPHSVESVIPLVLVPERVYMRVVIHTEHPEDFNLIIEKVAR